MPTKTPTEEADAAWKQVFVEGPYTGFVMIDYLRSHANNITWTDILKSGYTNKKGLVALSVANKKEAIMKDAKLNTTWAGTTGRCTSFAVKVISQLEQKSPGTFKFNIYDIGRHRVARCEKTGILIDSSSKNGAFPLPEGEWVRIEGSDASWKWDKGKSKFERTAGSSGIVSCFPWFTLNWYFLLSFPTTFSSPNSQAPSSRFFPFSELVPDFAQSY